MFWEKSIDLVVLIYKVMDLSQGEKFGLTSHNDELLAVPAISRRDEDAIRKGVCILSIKRPGIDQRSRNRVTDSTSMGYLDRKGL